MKRGIWCEKPVPFSEGVDRKQRLRNAWQSVVSS
jgi:hypothetical protein